MIVFKSSIFFQIHHVAWRIHRLPTKTKLYEGKQIKRKFIFKQPIGKNETAISSQFLFFFFQSWKRLSRFQRSLIYFLSVITVLTFIYFSWVNEEKPIAIQVVTEDDIKQIDVGVLDAPMSQENNVPKNKVEAVQKALDANKAINDIENKGQEEYEDEKMYEGDDEGHDGNDLINKDSNQAAEEYVDAKKHLEENKKSVKLPVLDGSVVFRGPTNQRQVAVVDAFKHAWTGYKTYAWG